MSLFTSRRLHVAIEPERLSAALVKVGFSTSIEREATLDIVVETHLATGFGELAALLGQDAWRAPRLRVTLSDRLAKYFTVDAVPGLRMVSDLDALAAMRFEHLFGLPADEWVIKADWGIGAPSAAACAIPKPLVDALVELSRKLGLRLESVQPFYIVEFNRLRRRLAKGVAWFAVAETQSMTVGLYVDRMWRGIRCHAMLPSPEETLIRALERDRPLFTQDDRESPLFVAGFPIVHDSAGKTSQVLPAPLWPAKSADWSRTFRLALAEYWP